VLLCDIGKAARGEIGRTLVYCVIYSLDATRCIILQLAATQSLHHALGAAALPMWQCGLVVVLLAGLLSQVRATTFRNQLQETAAGNSCVTVCFQALGKCDWPLALQRVDNTAMLIAAGTTSRSSHLQCAAAHHLLSPLGRNTVPQLLLLHVATNSHNY
jgi:hypothetical protein